ncbi:hypothetical protein K1T71_007559 [Dendrolimus kikuchii]|uniref:Uncharacterized protein n=1 Tax=Dendrolimus kikuchii TaxID=765133 RepID=A0ACC1CXU0_9NEOP|nr:hypothetical protein K1T71_007559 [Dendrolimus kikuchii]
MDMLMLKNLCPAGKQALTCFLLSASIFTISFFSGSVLGYSAELWALKYWGPALYFCLFNFILRYCYNGFIYEVSIRSAFLGAVFATGLYISTLDDGWKVFGLYTMVLTMFHFTEFLSVAWTNPSTLTIDSFILNHSVQYGLAAVASWIEWAVEYYFFPGMKTYFWLSWMGVLMCICGELMRKSAMFTAKTNFTHTVQFVKKRDHELVTHGVYSICRHPSYVGWFYWSIGTQITLLNPICLVIYALASWTFFRERVYAEELTLLTFFGRHYVEYQKKVPTGLPLIKERGEIHTDAHDVIKESVQHTVDAIARYRNFVKAASISNVSSPPLTTARYKRNGRGIMSFRRLISAVRSVTEALNRGAPVADGVLKSILSLVVIFCITVSSPPAASAKPFALSFPAGWSLAGLVGSVGARSDNQERREPAGVKPYTGRRIANDTLRMIYYHDQTVAVVELGPDKLLLNCELIETIDEEDTARLLRQLSSINRPLGVTFPQMIKLMSQCQQVDGVEISEESRRVLSSGWREGSGDGAARARLDAGGAHAGLLGGSPLTLLQGIIPGTKWCGTGDIAANYHDLGADRRLDRCCRTHDLCPTKVRAFSSRYNLTNNSLYSKSHCTCDDMLFDCLKKTNTSASQVMGHIYFNLVQVPCLIDLPTGRGFRDAREGF